MFMCFRYMNEIRINTKIPRLIDTRNHVCLPCDLRSICCASAAKKRCGLSAAANAPQISVGKCHAPLVHDAASAIAAGDSDWLRFKGTIDCLVSISPGI